MHSFRLAGSRIGLAALVLCLTLGAAGEAAGQEFALGDIPLDPATYQRYLKVYPDKAEDSLPAAYDARDEGIVTTAKNQGGCGSCWAFASVGAMESHILALGGPLYDLSEQQQNSCNTSMGGCCGGSSSAPRFWESTGPITESCGPYGDGGTGCPTSSSVACSTMNACTRLPYRVTGWHTVSSADFKTSLYEEGPSYWRFTVYSDFGSYWSGGAPGEVYVNASGTSAQGGHAVLLIGWDDAKGAYLLKNSWGTTAGPNDDGTFWVAYTGHANSLSFGMSNFDLTLACEDQDGDGYGFPGDPDCTYPEEDCDDTDPDVNPGVVEGPDEDPLCSDVVDNDCDGVADLDDPGCWPCEDLDGDGYGSPAGENCMFPQEDCDDTNPAVNPGTAEGPHGEASCADGWDNDCDGTVDTLDPGCLYPLFEPAADYGAGTEPLSVVAVDLNGDGSLDLAVADAAEDRVGVLRGNGDGTFLPAVFYGVGVRPVSVTAGDVNGDGYTDLVTANEENDNVSVLLGDGDWTLSGYWALYVPGRPTAVAIEDLDQDGIPDLAVACEGYDGETGHVSVLMGVGGDAFLDPVSYAAGYGVVDVAAGDLNGDGSPDLMVANLDNDNVTVWLGNGDGTFLLSSDVYVPARPSAVRLAQLDGEGDLDLLVSCWGYAGESGNLSVLMGNGHGNFEPFVPYSAGLETAALGLGFIDQGPAMDVVVAARAEDRLLVFEGQGDGSFALGREVETGDGPGSVAVGDLDLDGADDVAVANRFDGTVTVLLNALGGPCIDLDGDGYGDPPGVSCPQSAWDCDDADPGTYPGAPEMCDGRDNSCEGVVDEEPAASAGCDNGLFCDGEESCAGGGCQAGTPVVCADDGVGCTEEACDEVSEGCVSFPRDSFCDDGLWCNGAETCDPLLDCRPGTAVDCDDGSQCTRDACDEGAEACVHDCVAADPADPCCADPACAGAPACLGPACADADEDGYSPEGGDCGEVDCDDADPSVNPGAAEICDGLGIDEDCDGLTDAADPDCVPDYPPSSHAMAFGNGSFVGSGIANQALFLFFPLGACVLLRFLNRRR